LGEWRLVVQADLTDVATVFKVKRS
jgi:hypothetical protein